MPERPVPIAGIRKECGDARGYDLRCDRLVSDWTDIAESKQIEQADVDDVCEATDGAELREFGSKATEIHGMTLTAWRLPLGRESRAP